MYNQVPGEESVARKAESSHSSPGVQGDPFGMAILRAPEPIVSGVMLCAQNGRICLEII